MWGTHICNGILLSCKKKNEILLFATSQIDLGDIMLSEISQRQIQYDVIYMWNLKNTNTNLNSVEYKCKTGTDIDNQLSEGREKGEE